MAPVAQSIIAITEQPFWIYGASGPLRAELSVLLSQFSWQQTHELSHIKQSLLNSSECTVVVDLAVAPHRYLAQIKFLQEHFDHCVLIAVIDPAQNHWGQEALRQGADAYIAAEAISAEGFTMLLESLYKQKRQQRLLATSLDPCTGLITSPLFFDRLNHAMQVSVRHKCRTGLLLIAIHDFKKVVEQLGDVLCDGLLKSVSQILSEAVRNSDSVCRMREGEFAILLEDLQDDVMLGHIAQQIQLAFQAPIRFQNADYSIQVTIGGHISKGGDIHFDTFFQQCEAALERAQGVGPNRIWFYSPDMNFKAMARINMQQGLQRALDRQEFFMLYQPSHSAKGFLNNGAFPVLRWRHPTAGIVMSDVFMALLKDSGLILPVGRWQIETVLKQLGEWRREGNWKLSQKLILPVCEKQLRETGFNEFLKQSLLSNELDTEHVVLQISEQTAIRNLVLLQGLCQDLSGLGLSIYLSDFGEQYSSLSYLRQLNVENICLDQSFFLHMHMDHLETSIAKVIVDVAHRLGIDVIAEGADSQYKVEKMQALGCDTLIGAFFSQPMNSDIWPDYLKSSAH